MEKLKDKLELNDLIQPYNYGKRNFDKLWPTIYMVCTSSKGSD